VSPQSLGPVPIPGFTATELSRSTVAEALRRNILNPPTNSAEEPIFLNVTTPPTTNFENRNEVVRGRSAPKYSEPSRTA